jgi:MoaA/NifB/PqqE/SkfB family radical SAM enzyme
MSGDDTRRSDGLCRAAPEWLVLSVNNFCNLHCRMCDVGLGETGTPFYENLVGSGPGSMDRDLYLRILDEAASFAPPPRIGLAYTEPLLHREIVDFCREAARRKLYSSVTTNGYLLPVRAQGLLEAGLDEITVSVDGPAETHARVRRSADSYERLYRGIERLNELSRGRRRRPRVQLSYTITVDNYTAMTELAKDVEPLVPDLLTFSHLNFVTQEMADLHNAAYPHPGLRVARSNLGTMDLDRIDLDALWSALGELRAYAAGARFPVQAVPDFSRREELERFYRSPLLFVGGRDCADPFRMLLIQTDGEVIPAHGRCYHLRLGKVPGESLGSIWNGRAAIEFRKRLRDAGGSLPACARCCGVIGKKGSGKSP